MFRKPPRLKPNAPVRASDRRKLVAELKRAFPILNNLPDDLQQRLLPTDIQAGKFVSCTDDQGVLYFNASDQPLWIMISQKNDKDIWLPTLYSAWLVRGLLPEIAPFPAVLSKLFDGAGNPFLIYTT